jgi:hypothetical protein
MGQKDDAILFKLNQRLLVLPISLLAFLLVTITQLSQYNGEIFLINALIFIAVYVFTQQQKTLHLLSLLFAGSLAGFAALQLIDSEYLGSVLLLEALLLLWLGCKEFFTAVRIEAYLLLALGIIANLIGLADSINLSASGFSHFSIYNFTLSILLLCAGALYLSAYLIKSLLKSEDYKQTIKFEMGIYRIIKESLSVAYLACLVFISLIVTYDYALNFLPLISLLPLYFA